MAGKLQLAAKCLLGTTLLASGTGGVYYATTHGWTGPAKTAKHSTAELDALAGAWAEPAAKHASVAPDSSPVARSADIAPAHNDKPTTKPVEVDRYAATKKAPTPASAPAAVTPAVVKEEKSKKKDAKEVAKEEKKKKEPTPAKADDAPAVKLASHTEDKKTDKVEHVPTPAALTPEPSLARGQEPKDDMPATAVQVKDVSADISGAFDSPPKSAATPATPAAKEPKALNPPDQLGGNSQSAQNAKQAFGNATPLPPGDRYSSGSLAAPPTPAQPKPATINPFDSAPASASPINAKNDRIAPLSGSPNDTVAPLRELQPPPANAMRSMDSTPTASRTTNRDYGSKNRLPQASPFASAPTTNAGNAAPYTPTRSAALGGPADMQPQPMLGDGTGKPGEKALEGPQQPTLVIQKFAPGEIQVGKPAKFVLQVRNSGAQAADNVTIHDEVPQGTQLVSTSPSATTEGSRLTWQLGKLSPGEDRTIEMQVMPKSEGDIGSVATVTYSAQASVKTHCTMPQLAIRMTAPSEVMIGKQQHVKIEIRNPGSGDATGVMLFENVPPNVKHAAGPTLEFEIGTLHAGESRELDLVLNAEKAGKVTNTLTAKAQGNLQVQQSVDFEVIAPALTVAVQGPEKRYLERAATYEVSVENPGTAPAHDVQIVTKLPKGMRFVKANNMGEYDAASHAVYWSLAELPKGEKGTVELTAMPVETGQQTLQVESHAQQGLADKTQRDVLVEGLSAIKFEVRSLQDPVEVGGEANYEIRVVNQGTKAAANVLITADLPAGMKLVSAEGESQHKADQNHLTFEPIAQLAPKADTVFRIRAQALQAGDQRIVVEVKTDDLQQPIRREESTRVFGDQ
jgi:uncharacterized repeat protein (TIGR01451 family)